MSPRVLPSLPLLATALVAAAALLGGCADTERPLDVVFAELSSPETEVVDAAVVELGRRARNDPALVARLVQALEKDRADPDSSELMFQVDLARVPEALRGDAPAEVARVFQNRLAAHRIPARLLETRGSNGIRVLLERPPPEVDETAFLERTIAILEGPGVVELLAVAPRPGGGAGPAWPGDAASFDAHVSSESARWRPMAVGDADPEGGREGWRVAPAGKEGEATRWLVLREPEAGRRFDERSMTVVVEGGAGRPARLLIRISPERQEVFASWTAGLAGGEVALLVDGRAAALGTVPGELRDGLALAPLDPSDPEAAFAVARAAQGGRLRWPVAGRIVPGAPAVDGPLARALAGAGPIADEPLAALERAGGPAAPAARWAREEILKQRTRTGR